MPTITAQELSHSQFNSALDSICDQMYTTGPGLRYGSRWNPPEALLAGSFLFFDN
jgi:hypothetical protein